MDVAASQLTSYFHIPEVNMDQFVRRIDALSKRANKLGMSEVGYKIIELKPLPVKSRSDALMMTYSVEVFGQNPVISGWRFIAKLEHLDGTDRPKIIGFNSDEVPQSYRQCQPDCDHCKSNRKRNNTYLLKNIETGEFKRVGKSCLEDFFGGGDPLAIAAYSELMSEFANDANGLGDFDEYSSSIHGALSFSVLGVLEKSAAIIRHNGYISRAKGEAMSIMTTGDLLREQYGRRPPHLEINDADQKEARVVLDWLHSDELKVDAETNMYAHNLIAIAESGFVRGKDMSLAASAIASHAGSLRKKQQAEEDKISDYVGEAGKKCELIAKLDHVVVLQGMFISYLHLFTDNHGNKLVWRTSSATDFKIGHPYAILSTVKGHDLYRDIKQTALLRVTAPDTDIFKHIESGDEKKFAKRLKGMYDIDVPETYGDGRTPLMVAIAFERKEMAMALIDAGASLTAQDKNGAAVRAYAEAHPDLIPDLISQLESEVAVPAC